MARREGAFSDPFILKSEHKMVLDHAQKRGDEKARTEYNRGYLEGIVQTIWIVGFAAFGAALLGFNVGIRVTGL